MAKGNANLRRSADPKKTTDKVMTGSARKAISPYKFFLGKKK